MAPDGQTTLGVQSGIYSLFEPGQSTRSLEISNEIDAARSGLWSGDMVAYWGNLDGAVTLAVTHTDSDQTLQLSANSATPIQPMVWVPDSTQLVYRGASGDFFLADVGCLQTTCESNPLDQGIALMPASATDVQIVGGWGYYRDGRQIRAVPLACTQNDTCFSEAITLGTNAAPRTLMHVVDDILIYTAFRANSGDATDRVVRIVDTTCLPDGCQAVDLLDRATAGLISPDGNYVVVDIVGEGLHTLNLTSLDRQYLTAITGLPTESLIHARWND
jgi:hypothetical protein